MMIIIHNRTTSKLYFFSIWVQMERQSCYSHTNFKFHTHAESATFLDHLSIERVEIHLRVKKANIEHIFIRIKFKQNKKFIDLE